MATIVRMPSVLAGASEAAINKWLVAEGAAVVVGEPFAELETEKAVVEYNAEIGGILGRIITPEGKVAAIGDPIAVVISEGETAADIDALLGAEAPAPAAAPAAAPAEAAPAAAAPVAVAVPAAPAAAPAVVVAAPAAAASSDGRLFASPLARKLARERGLDLSSVNGSGPGGRIVRRDLDNAPAASAAPVAGAGAGAVAAAAAQPGPAQLIPHSGMRKAIARRLTESKTTVPHFYLTAECKVDALFALRAQINSTPNVKVSVNDFVVLAVAKAFVDVPEANVTWTDEGMLKYQSVDISIAVSTEGGLLTPVLRNAANKSLTAISAEVADLAARARDKKIKQDELEGGAFSISNLGMYGTLEFSAILNPPQSGILAVGAAIDQPIVVDGQLTVGKVMRVTLSADHRAVDGALAAEWLAAFQKRIENPVTLLI
jgi:pyruvate dehydrogenase E2 component (dihydrolipoamide acetyltransferase)